MSFIRFLVLCSFVPALLLAQSPEWKVYKPTNTGMQGSFCGGLLLDTDGTSIWVAAHDQIWDEGGVSKFDGRRWYNWSTVDSAIPDYEIAGLLRDHQGNIWAASHEGLLKFDGETWTQYGRAQVPAMPSDTITDLAIDSAGNIWFSMGSVEYNIGGVGRFDGDSFRFWTSYSGLPWPDHWEDVECIACGPGGVVYAGSYTVGVCKWNGSGWTYLGTEAGGWMGDIVVEPGGKVWFGAASGELVTLEGSTWTHHGMPSSGILGLALRSAGGVWVASPAGIHIYNGSWQNLNWPHRFGYVIVEAPDSSIWAGGLDGIGHYKNGTWDPYGVQNTGLTERWINGIDFDGHRNVWVSTAGGGLCRFDGETWLDFNPFTWGYPPWPYATDQTMAAVEAADGRMFVGTYGQGIVVWDGTSWVRQYLQHQVIDNIIRDSTGGLWCQANSGLYHFEGDTWRRFDYSNSPLPGYVFGLGADVAGWIWVATLGGLVRTDGASWEVYTPATSGMPGNGRCYSPSRAPDGAVWMTAGLNEDYTRSGVLRFRREDTTWTVFDSSNAPIHHVVGTVAVTSRGIVWVGFFRGNQVPYRGGVARYDGTNWVMYDRDNSPLPHEQIYDIGIDWNDNPWISCASEGMAVIYDNPLPVEEDRKLQAPNPKVEAFPNPFRGATTIRLGARGTRPSEVTIVDVAGRRVRVLRTSPAAPSVKWDGMDDSGRPVRSGVYFAQVLAGTEPMLKVVRFDGIE